jgi:hypothetical protein
MTSGFAQQTNWRAGQQLSLSPSSFNPGRS